MSDDRQEPEPPPGPVLALLVRYRKQLVAAFALLMALAVLGVLYGGAFVVGGARVAFLEGYDTNDPWEGFDGPTLVLLLGFVAVQVLFIGTVRATVRRAKPARSASSAFGLIATFALALLACAVAFTVLELVDRFGWDHVTTVRETHTADGISHAALLLGILGVAWVGWAAALWFAHARAKWPWIKIVRRAVRLLLAGSWIEFVAALAVDAGMRARPKDDCYCTRGTFFSLFLGIPLLLLAVGPGLYLLFHEYKRDPAAARATVKAATRVEAP